MNKHSIKRRDFLKGMGTVLAGVFLAPLARLFRHQKGKAGGTAPVREAMYYTSGDNLAG